MVTLFHAIARKVEKIHGFPFNKTRAVFGNVIPNFLYIGSD